jgi:TM2 domain-containing membrane protein YozV
MDYPRPLDPPEPQQQQQVQQSQMPGQVMALAPQQSQVPGQAMALWSQKDWTTTAFLCVFLGVLGVHRFYSGRVVSGIFQLLTIGGCGVWTLVDLVTIITGRFTDKEGRPLYHPPVVGGKSSWQTTALLCVFLGSLGIHRFYSGHIVTGILQLLTGGGCGIWLLIDLIMIFTDNFRDGSGAPLTRMQSQMQYGMMG